MTELKYLHKLKHQSVTIVLPILALLITTSTLTAQPDSTDQQIPVSKMSWQAVAQFWMRHTDLNPGSTIQGTHQSQTSDISVRRFRLRASTDVTDRWFVKFQFGINNLNYLNRRPQLKILDVEAFYQVSDWLYIGGGKTAYIGLSRYAAPATSSTMGFDIPIFNLPTINISDDQLRKMSLVAKGQFNQLDYRLVFSKPMIPVNTVPISEYAEFERRAPEWQQSAYLKYQFFEEESQKSAFTPATYFGKKKVLAIGAGFLHQNNVTWSKNAQGDTLRHKLLLLSADLFIELPLNAKNSKSLTFYTGYFNYDFGPNYIRNIGVNNAADGVSSGSFNGRGNSLPAIGTGTIWYSQFAVRLKFHNEKAIQPYFAIQDAHYDRLDQPMILLDYGVNFLLDGHNSKLTLAMQSRPIYNHDPEQNLKVSERNLMAVIQYQVKVIGK